MTYLDTVRERIAAQQEAIRKLADAGDVIVRNAKGATLTGDESVRFDEIVADLERANADLDDLRARERELTDTVIRQANARKAPIGLAARVDRFDDSDRGQALRHIDAERRLPDVYRDAAVQVLEDVDTSSVASIAKVTADPDYTSAWLKSMRDPVRGHLEWTEPERQAFGRAAQVQRAMSVGTNSAGGFMVPFILDPSIVITGAGSINPMRNLATIKRVAAGNYHAITGGQISASWDTEASAVSDDSPTLTQPSIPLYMGRAFIPVSFEAFSDITDLAFEVAKLMADAKDNLEASAHWTGSGSAQPKGAVTAVGAVTASRVSPATGGTLAFADPYTVQNAEPARFSLRSSWASSITVINKIRQLAAAQNSANSVWTDVGNGQPPEFLGRRYNEASAMSASLTTGQDVLLYGDFSKYYVVDHIGSPTMEFIPNLFDTSTGRPTAQRGFMLWFRQGGDVVDADAFRVLRL